MRKMRKYLLLTLSIAFAFNSAAQIDRSVMPKGGPTPQIKLDKPKEFTLKNGIKVLVVENSKLPRVNYSLRFDRNPIFEGEKIGVLSLLGSMLGNGTTNISKVDFNEEVDFLGANISVGFGFASAFTLTKNNDRVLALFSDAVINPLLVEEEFDKEKAKLIESLKVEEKSLDAVSGRVQDALAFGKNHVYGEFITEENLNEISFEDVLEYHEKYFLPNNVYIVVIGDVKFKDVKSSLKKTFGKWEKGILAANPKPQMIPNVTNTEIDFIDLPTATQSNIYVTNNVELKMTDEDYFAALMANDILGGGGEGYLFKNLREDKGYTYGSYSNIGSSRYGVSSFSASAKVRNMVTDSAVVEILSEFSRIKSEKVDSTLLKNAKAKYVGSFIRRTERPQTIASYALNIKLNNLPEDFYETYLENINAVTQEDVMKVANKYFKDENSRIIIVGKGSEVIENLEKTGIPIKYFDKYANPTEKPEFSKPIPEGVTATSIMASYIEAIGGASAVESVKTLMFNAEVSIEGMPFKPTAVLKSMAPNKNSMEMSIAGMGTVMKQKFDGTTGYAEQGGMKQPMSEDDIAEQASQKGLFPEAHYTADDIQLISLSDLEGTDVYKIKVKGSSESFRYYDATSGLLLREEGTEEAQGQSITSITEHSDYRAVNGVMIPFGRKITAGPQIIGFTATEVIINSEVSETDFK